MFKRQILAACAAVIIAATAQAQSVLKENDRIALCGDSITEQKLYSQYVEAYLTLCQPTPVQVMQFGWGGETAPTFLGRMDNDVLSFKPTLATTLYGMNDGGYRAIDDGIRTKYLNAMDGIVDKFQKAGVRVIVGSPGAVDTKLFRPATPELDVVYNENLSVLGEQSKAVAEKYGQIFADVHSPMMAAQAPAKAKYGEDYPVCGNDGFHPGPNGHLLMAYSFLKAMKLDGQIGTVDVDLAGNKATGTDGQKIVSADGGKVTIESTRFPFCFVGDPKAKDSAVSILPFVPFSDELNRYVLRVTGPAGSYKVTWGDESKTFTADQLKAGVNLAAEFTANPFTPTFAEVTKAISAKQNFETKAFKTIVRGAGAVREDLKDDAALDGVMESVKRRHAQLTADIAKAVKPVTHTITIEAQ